MPNLDDIASVQTLAHLVFLADINANITQAAFAAKHFQVAQFLLLVDAGTYAASLRPALWSLSGYFSANWITSAGTLRFACCVTCS
jgi:hypothetical protein